MDETRPPALLTVLADLIKAHPLRGESEPLNVVRVVAAGTQYLGEESDHVIPQLLEAASAFTGVGMAHDASRALDTAELSDPAPDADLLTALRVAMRIERPTGDAQELELQDGRLLLGGVEAELLGPGHSQLVGLAAALLDTRWEGAELGIVSYGEVTMDPFTKRAAKLGIAALGGPIGVGSLRTLIVIARAPELVLDEHCHAETGARYIIDGDRAIKRRPMADTRSLAGSLARSTAPLRVFFLGAGFARSSDLPLGNTLRNWALRRRYGSPHDAPIRPLAIELFREAEGLIDDGRDETTFAEELTLEDVVALDTAIDGEISPAIQHFAELHANCSPGPAVRGFVESISKLEPAVVVTVNFDELLEEVDEDAFARVFDDEGFEAFPEYLARYLAGEEMQVPLLKLHGTISTPESCVVDAKETSAPLPENKARALGELPSALAGETGTAGRWIYIGASLRDKDVVPVLLQEQFATAFEEYWVMPLRERSIDRFARARHAAWKHGRQQIDERTVSATADDFISLLATELG